MITEKIILVTLICITVCFVAWCGTKNTNGKNDKKDGGSK